MLVDDHPLILDALENLLGAEDDIRVVARCESGPEALAALRNCRPEVIILDLLMPGMDGLDFLRAMNDKRLEGRVVLLTGAADEAQMIEAVRLGVQGVVLKEMAPRLLLQCIRSVAAGRQWLERRSASSALAGLLKRDHGARVAATAGLTPREIEIVRSICHGLRNKAIAEQLRVSEGTVKVHLHNIYRKLGVDNRLALFIYAKEQGIV